MASAATSRSSFSVAPLAACTARPFSTVAVFFVPSVLRPVPMMHMACARVAHHEKA